jgi:hypothetical protein
MVAVAWRRNAVDDRRLRWEQPSGLAVGHRVAFRRGGVGLIAGHCCRTGEVPRAPSDETCRAAVRYCVRHSLKNCHTSARRDACRPGRHVAVAHTSRRHAEELPAAVLSGANRIRSCLEVASRSSQMEVGRTA